MLTDIEIAQAATLRPILALAQERLAIPEDRLEPYGRYKAKLSLAHLQSLPERPGAKLVLVSGISPTPAGEGKTTTTVGLGDGLNRIGKNAIVCLREPSLGPVFGMKGGAAGGGYAQVVPMEDINLHFTGDFNASALAHNLLAALIDNHLHHGNALGIDLRRITWRRVMDMNDRALREITVGLGGPGNELAHHEVPLVVSRHWSDGGAGAEELARAVVHVADTLPADMRYVYEDEQTLWQKTEAVATKIYGASSISADGKVRAELKRLQDQGYGHFPVCIAKTQYSFATDPTLRGAPSGHVMNIREVRLAAGAEFVVLVCGDILTMPGLPARPSSANIDVDEAGRIGGLF